MKQLKNKLTKTNKQHTEKSEKQKRNEQHTKTNN